MTKQGALRCIHCLKSVDAITDDHLFPKSWYPTTTPPNLEKWKLPACRPCNAEYGKIEEELRLGLASTLDPSAPGSAGIWQEALNSLTPERGRNPLDQLRRKLKRQKFLKRLMPVKPDMMKHALPEIDPDRPKGTMALLVPGSHIKRFIEKLVRGTVYLTEGRYVEPEQEITTSLLHADDGREITEMIEQFGELYERGPGIRIRKAVAHDAKTSALFVFDIWGQYRFHGAVMDRE
jgi:hypothetical protein